MEEVFKIVAFAIISVVLILLLKEQKPEISLMLTVAASIFIMFFELTKCLLFLNY